MNDDAVARQAHSAAGTPREGDVLAGRYEVEGVLGVGGMGVVVSAKDRHLGRRVAIKLLGDVLVADAENLARFQREARAVATLESEHVARVLDVATVDGAPMLVMEHLSGTDLEQVLASRGPLPIAEAVDYVLEASEALAEAHALGIVHRDLKPANLFLARRSDGTTVVKVLDFGIAKLDGADSREEKSLTRTGAVLGSPLYMSPEQLRSARNAGPASDIWALGAVLHELLAGRPPFHGDTLTAVSAAIVADRAAALRAQRPEAPEALERAILRCLEKDPARRFGTLAELALELEAFGSDACHASVAKITTILGHVAETLPPPDGATDASLRPRRTTPRAAAAALAVLVVAGTIAFALAGRHPRPATDEPIPPRVAADVSTTPPATAVPVGAVEPAPSDPPGPAATTEAGPTPRPKPTTATKPATAPRSTRVPPVSVGAPHTPGGDDGLDERH